jgi:hypothetical protein
LPFPKPVGIETAGDLCQIRLKKDPGVDDPGYLAVALQRQLPSGLRITQAWISAAKDCYHPVLAEYWLAVGPGLDLDQLRVRVQGILQRPSIPLARQAPKGRTEVDLRPFIDGIDVDDRICVRCRIINGATIRIGEVLELLGLTVVDLDRPILRKTVQWTTSATQQMDRYPWQESC